jgi:hypothetical protein
MALLDALHKLRATRLDAGFYGADRHGHKVRYMRGNNASFQAAKYIVESMSQQTVLLFSRDADGSLDY